MESEKAKAHLKRYAEIIEGCKMIVCDEAEEAVDLAEEDARVRSLKAVCLTFCRCQKPCQYPNDCEKKDLFLENYKKS